MDTSIQQPLFHAIGPDGNKVVFVMLNDGRCAVMRNGDVIHTGPGDQTGIQDAVSRFLSMIKLNELIQ